MAPTTVTAAQVMPGDVLKTAVGPTLVVAVKPVGTGLEFRVDRRGDNPYLWHWPQQTLTVLRRDPGRLERWWARRKADGDRLKQRREAVGPRPSCHDRPPDVRG
jgi:hypothetical protein